MTSTCGSWARLAAALLLASAAAAARPGAPGVDAAAVPPPSFVISVKAQRAGRQAYPRGVNNKGISIAVGSGSNQVNSTFTVDTGSGLLELSCRTPASLANCKNKTTLSKSYALTSAKTVSSAAVCAQTGVDCLVPGSGSKPDSCFYSQGLTGGNGWHGYSGTFAQDTVTVLNVLSSAPLSFSGIFGCAQATYSCGEQNKTCMLAESACPASSRQLAKQLQGGCPGNHNAIEAGWTFSAGGRASAVAVPEQVFQAGLIRQRVMGVCWQRPQKDSNCSAAIAPNSAVVLGPALPTAVSSIAKLSVAPLFNATIAGAKDGAATHTFRSSVTGGVSVARFNTSQPWAINTTSNVLWDTGAYGQSIVPAKAFAAFLAYYTAAQPQAAKLFDIVPCGANASAYCGSNFPTGPNSSYACQRIQLAPNASAATVAAARKALLGMYPPSIDITLLGGVVAQLPAAFVQNDCGGAGNTATSGVAVCSYVRPPPSGSGSNYFWLAGPWFDSRFVQFDLTPNAGGWTKATGVMRFSGLLDSCAFPSL